MNEVSNGISGSGGGAQEYAEFVVVSNAVTYNCASPTPPCIDIRGWIFDDNSGYHGPSGIATGAVRFSQNALWSCLPLGTIILIYNDADRNPAIPPDDLSMADGNCTIIAPISNTTLFEKNTTTPGAAACSYPAAGWVAGGNWTYTALANSSDCARIVNLAGCEVFSVCYGTADNLNNLIYFSATGTNTVYWFNDVDPQQQANWSSGVSATFQTPGAPNNAANAAYIAQFNNGCMPITPIVVTATSVNAGCGCTGSATASASGSIGGYTYSWYNSSFTSIGQNTATATGLCAGVYHVIGTSHIGCTDTATVTITSGGSFTSTTTQTNVSCNGSSTGSATVTPSGGTPAYTYAWSPSGGTAATASSLAAGNYTCTITDASSCSITKTFVITQPTALSVTTTPTAVACNGGTTGSISSTVTGGTTAYTYSWAPSGGTAATASSLAAGTYTLTVTDANSCTKTSSAIITQPTVLAVTTTPAAVVCNGGTTGSISSTVSGGTSAYTYSWAPSGGTAATASSLVAGTYTLTVTDANSCTKTSTAIVNQPTSLSVSTTTVAATCGSANGQATATATGGTTAYVYAWTPSGGTAATATGLAAGNYTVTVTDAHACVAISPVTITNTGSVSATTAQTNVSCFGGTNGTATVTASGGTPAYSYVWVPSGGTSATAAGLTAGNYTCTITDASSCSITKTFVITQPAALSVTTTPTAVSCNGGANGSISSTVSGGTTTYSYSWAPSGGTSATASGLVAGTYTLTVTDANSCTKTSTAIITQPTVLSVNTTPTAISCNGGSNGSISSIVSGGTAAYTYSWAPSGGTAATASGLGVGTYTLTVTDANTCSQTSTAIITQPAVLSVATTPTAVACNGGSTGSISSTVSGGTTSYSYSWAPSGGTAATASSLAAGTYTLTVTDANACTKTSTAIITQPAVLSVTTTPTAVACNGGATGSISSTVSGGTTTYTYSWAPSGGTATTASGLVAGTYTLTVTDANSCIKTSTAIVTQPTALSVTTTPTAITCNGGTTGSISSTVSGGTTTYTYSWAPSGGTSATAGSLVAGTYTLTVTDANSCTQTSTAIVTEPTIINISITNTPALCGSSNGTASSTVTGGIGPYTFSWASSGGTSTNASSLAAGIYTLTVTDANGCVKTGTTSISNTGGVAASVTTTSVSCNGGNNGTATATGTGGTAPYTYSWAPSGGTAITATSLSAGIYSVTITDNAGCVATATTTISQPTLITATTISTPTSCFSGSNGSATVTATGGTGAYTYLWLPSGGTAITATGLSAGNYSVAITDANSCSQTFTTSVTQPTSVSVTILPTAATCNGIASGSAIASVIGGTGAYSYSWTPSGGSLSSASALAVGNYTATVTDANGCIGSANTIISQPTAIAISFVTIAATCGSSNGSSVSTVSGGNGPYTYSWAPSGGTLATATGLSAGIYTLTVTDANSCVNTGTSTISNIGSATVTTSNTAVSCNSGSDGTATATAIGGAAPYTYLWSPSGGTALTATNLSAGTYTVNVTDALGCLVLATTIITEPSALSVNIIPTAVSCNGGNDGSATATVTGGTGTYTYAWTPSGGTAATATGLSAGNFSLTVTDANGCTQIPTTNVIQPTLLTAIVSTTPVSCNGGSDGSATSTATGGTGAYTYSWSPSGGTALTATNLISGSYSVTITDANGCTTTANNNVLEPGAINITLTNSAAMCGLNNGSATSVITGGTGAYTYLWSPSGGTSSTANGLAPGTYTLAVTDANACTNTATTTVNSSGVVTLSIVNTPVTCNGGTDGTATVTATGGTGPYLYSWTPSGGTVATANGLSATSFTATVTDAAGCATTISTTINEPGPILVATNNVSVCNGQAANLTATASGGLAPYTYNWNSGAGSGNAFSITSASTTTVSVSVTDANGCSSLIPASAIITVTPPLNVHITGGKEICPGTPITLTASASGGNGNYTFLWTPGTLNGSSITVSPQSNIVYAVQLSDGCTVTTAQDTELVSMAPTPIVNFVADALSGCAPLCINLTSISSGSISSLNWNFGDNLYLNSTSNTPYHCYKTDGVYSISLTAISAKGCSTTVVKNNYINVYPVPIAAFIADPEVTDIYNTEIHFTDQSIGATALLWYFGDTTLSNAHNPVHTYIYEGTYQTQLIATNDKGCADTVIHDIFIKGDFTFYAPNAFTPNNDKENDVFLPTGIAWDPKHYKLWIFDRWGNMCYTTDDITKGWDGKANQGSEMAQIDVYVWKVELKDIYGGRHSFKGTVSIVK